MISAAKTNEPSSGFTLIEIVMVLALAAVLIGGALGIMFNSSDEKPLKNTSGEIELLAKRAHTISILHQTPYALEFRQGIVRLLPLAQAGMDPKRVSKDPVADAAGSDKNRQVVLEEGVNLEIRRWNTEKWLGIAKDGVEIWRFDPDGLCEPLSIHIGYRNSWMEETFHPLTASSIPAEKRSEIR